jgi:hypothetical protein
MGELADIYHVSLLMLLIFDSAHGTAGTGSEEREGD